MDKKDIILRIVEKAKKKMLTTTYSDIDDFKDVRTWISSGVASVDYLLNTFGYNPGIMEVAGISRSGKTTLLLHALKEVHRKGGVSLVISTERRERKENVIRMGIDPTLLPIKKVKTIEAIFDEAIKYIELVREESPEIPLLIGIDSLGATPTKAEMNAKEDQEFMAVAARVIKGRLRRITQIIDDQNTILFVVNQTYNKVGQVFGKKSTSYGGEGLKFHRQLGLETTKLSTIKFGDKATARKIGQITRVEITKSDFTLPEKYIDIPLLWGYGYIPSKELLEFGVENNVLDNYKNGYIVKNMKEIKWKSLAEYHGLMITDKKAREILNRLLILSVHKEIKMQRGM